MVMSWSVRSADQSSSKYRRLVILTNRSCAQLSYKDAQTAIDGGKVEAKVESGHQDRIADDIRTLNVSERSQSALC
jgi:hypothetical protein